MDKLLSIVSSDILMVCVDYPEEIVECVRCKGKFPDGFHKNKNTGAVLCDSCYTELETLPYGLGETFAEIQEWE